MELTYLHGGNFTLSTCLIKILVFHVTSDLKKIAVQLVEIFFDDKLLPSSVFQRARDEAKLFLVMGCLREAAVAYHSFTRNILSNLLPIRRFGRDISKIWIWISSEIYTWLQWIALSII